MKISGIIAEYNPFHLGHRYQIESLKKEIDTFVVVVMSGDFVQRGECSVLDKYERAKIAIKNGTDLVVELPYYFSLQSAENFAKGSIEIFNRLNIVDYLCFGFECKKKETLIEVAKLQIKHKEEIELLLKEKMKSGSSYAVAYKDACLEVNKIYENIELDENFFISNNILSIEYIKNLILTNSKILPFPIKRIGENYNSENISNIQASASAIRKTILENNLELIKNFVDENTFKAISNVIKNKNFPDEKKIMEVLKYNVLQDNIDAKNIVNYENGILNLIKKNIFNFESIEQLTENIQSKRYKKVRIKRFIYNYLLNVNNDIKSIYESQIEYIKILAFNENGKSILRKINEKSNLKIISKNKDFKDLSEIGKIRFKQEENSRKIYKLFTNRQQTNSFKKLFIETKNEITNE